MINDSISAAAKLPAELIGSGIDAGFDRMLSLATRVQNERATLNESETQELSLLLRRYFPGEFAKGALAVEAAVRKCVPAAPSPTGMFAYRG